MAYLCHRRCQRGRRSPQKPSSEWGQDLALRDRAAGYLYPHDEPRDRDRQLNRDHEELSRRITSIVVTDVETWKRFGRRSPEATDQTPCCPLLPVLRRGSIGLKRRLPAGYSRGSAVKSRPSGSEVSGKQLQGSEGGDHIRDALSATWTFASMPALR